MLAYLTRRLIQSIIVLLGLTFIIFFILNLSGDPIRLLLPPDTPQADVDAFREARGLNEPLLIRYGNFLTQVTRLEFGDSIQLREDALTLVLDRLPATLSLALLAILVAIVIGIPLGVLAAVRRNSLVDSVVSFVAITGQSTPIFWLGIMGVLLFAVKWRLLPASGTGTWQHYVLPVGTLSLFLIGGIVRVTRTSLLDVLNKPYIRTAIAKGENRRKVIWKHAFRNAAIPIVTQIGLQMRFVIGGSVITESIFAWPGLGRLLVRSVYARDYPVVEAGVFVIAIFLIIINTLVDLSYSYLNPRVDLK